MRWVLQSVYDGEVFPSKTDVEIWVEKGDGWFWPVCVSVAATAFLSDPSEEQTSLGLKRKV